MNTSDLHFAETILEKIQALNIKDEPISELRNIIKEYDFNNIIIPFIIKKGTKLFRARINDERKEFNLISKLSYPPKSACNYYQRANIKGEPMFYASIQEPNSNDSIYDCLAAMLFESSNFARNTKIDGKQVVTYGVWEVKRDLNVFSFPYSHDSFKTPSKYLFEQQNLLISKLNKSNGYDFKENKLLGFLAKSISSTSKSESDYFIIANIIHHILFGFSDYDGVLYLSTRMNGLVVNFALKPDIVDHYLEFKEASIQFLQKKDGNMSLMPAFDGLPSNNSTITYELTKVAEDTFKNMCPEIIKHL